MYPLLCIYSHPSVVALEENLDLGEVGDLTVVLIHSKKIKFGLKFLLENTDTTIKHI